VKLVLASSSPQRREILASLGVPFEVRPSGAREDDEGPPVVVAQENALRKAVASRAHTAEGGGSDDDEVVLAVDTLVATELEIWGKPPNEQAAAETLRRLSGRTHEVISGFAFVRGGDVRAGHEITKVTFRELDERTIAWYIASREWEGRAGGYAIQGRGGALVRRIEGDYLNVVGLPVAALIELWPDLMSQAL
jgi:septum formation protein